MTTRHFSNLFLLLFIVTWTVHAQSAKSELQIHTDFPGGSARLESIDQTHRVIRLIPSPRPDRGWECWWYFKVTGIQSGETLTVDIGGMSFALPDQATFSTDNKTWTHTEKGKRDKQRVTFQQKIDSSTAWFAWGPPFQLSDANELIKHAVKSSRHATAVELCKSTEGHPVPALRVSEPGANEGERRGIWISARQHAWESGSSWVCRGLVEWLVSEDPRATALRQKADIFIVPIMDVDNVEVGAGGKNQKPQDHNRDWSDTPHWPAVRAAMKHISTANAAGRFDLFLDLHNPAPGDRTLMFFVPPREIQSESQLANLERFVANAKIEMAQSPLQPEKIVYTGINYDPNWERISGNWVVRHTSGQVAGLCLETAWNTPHSTTTGYLRVGRELGLAIERYFQQDNRKSKP